MDTISLAAATILTGLSAGLLYGWRVSVIPGTRRTSSHAYVETMQAINRAILNPPSFCLSWRARGDRRRDGCLVRRRRQRSRRAARLRARALPHDDGRHRAVGNIPLNDQLEAFDVSGATSDEVNAARCVRTSVEPLARRSHGEFGVRLCVVCARGVRRRELT